jgi:hypothetical protein
MDGSRQVVVALGSASTNLVLEIDVSVQNKKKQAHE